MLMVMDSMGGITEKILIFYYGDLGNILFSTPNKEWAVFFINIFLQHTGTWGVLVYYIIFTILQCDLPPLRLHCGEDPVRDLNQGRVV